MASSIRRKLATLVISLAFLVISLPVPTFALLASPEINTRGIMVVTDGIRTPAGITLDAVDGSIYVTDPVKRGVIQFNKYGKPVMFFKTEGVPQRVAVARNGNGSVIVAQGGFVAQYNNNGVESFRLRQGVDSFPFRFASGVAVHPGNGNIYVVDAGTNKISVFDSTGNYTGLSFGDHWQEGVDYLGNPIYHKLELPMDIQITSEVVNGVETNRVYVVDSKPTGLQIPVFSAAGVYERSLCGSGTGAGLNGVCQLTLPMGVTFDYTPEGAGRLYVSDPYQASVMVVDPSGVPGSPGVYGNFIRFIGSYGTNKGDLIVPTGVVFDRQNSRLIVANGYGNITFYPVDAGRNPVNHDSTLPIFDINHLTANNVTSSTFVISGTRESDQIKVQISVNTGAKAGATSYPTPTTWNCTITGLAEGRNEISAQGRDAAGNVLTKSVDLYYTMPMVAGFTINPYPGITASSTYTFTGDIPSGKTVTTNPGSTCSYPTATTWSCPVPLAVEGANTISFTVDTTITTATITKDTLVPVVLVYALGSGDATSSQVQNVMGTVDDPNLDTLTVKVNDNAAQPIAVTRDVFGFAARKGTYNFPVVLDRAGANTILIEAKDKVGNTATDSRIISLNMNAPSVALALEDGKTTRTASVALNGSVAPTSAVCTLNGNTIDISNTSVPLTPGFNNIVVSCNDSGRISKIKRTVYFDPNTLEVAVTSLKQDVASNQSAVTLNGAVDFEADLLIATVDGESHAVPINDRQFSLPASLAKEGAYSFQFTAVDGAGNITATTTRSIVADTTPPAIAITYGQTTASTVAGTVEPGATVVVKNFSNQTVGTVTLGDAAGNGTFSAALGQNYDLFSLVVAATDQAGNVTTISAAKPDGDCTGNGSVAPDDASICLDMVAGIRDPMMIERAHCDVGPLNNNLISPNGQIDITDCILVMRKAGGLPPVWW